MLTAALAVRALLASVLTEPLEVVAVWATTIALFAGAASAWTLLGAGTRGDVGDAGAVGAAVGFIAGFILASVAAIYLYVERH
jgi:hypothetical protein